MVSLRNWGIYTLPDGNEYILYWAEKGRAVLYDRRYGTSSTPVYVMNEQGEILDWPGTTPVFSSADMVSTGRTS